MVFFSIGKLHTQKSILPIPPGDKLCCHDPRREVLPY